MASFLLLFFLCLLPLPILAQQDAFRLGVGGALIGTIPVTEADDINPSWGIRGYVRYALLEEFLLEGGGGYYNYVDRQKVYDQLDVEGSAIPLDLRVILSPWPDARFRPFLLAGVGVTFYNADNEGTHLSSSHQHAPLTGSYLHFPVGIGASFSLSYNWQLELQAGNNLGMSDGLNPNLDGTNDHLWVGGVGFLYRFGKDSAAFAGEDPFVFDPEKLSVEEEKTSGPDADNDRLSDDEERLKYLTDPTKEDSDGDGLKDGEEVRKYKTDPRRADTDGDGLKDGEEAMRYRTKPLNVDTDGDGLTDGAEILTHRTDPHRADTDGDGLTDGEEVKKYKTDPLKAE